MVCYPNDPTETICLLTPPNTDQDPKGLPREVQICTDPPKDWCEESRCQMDLTLFKDAQTQPSEVRNSLLGCGSRIELEDVAQDSDNENWDGESGSLLQDAHALDQNESKDLNPNFRAVGLGGIGVKMPGTEGTRRVKETLEDSLNAEVPFAVNDSEKAGNITSTTEERACGKGRNLVGESISPEDNWEDKHRGQKLGSGLIRDLDQVDSSVISTEEFLQELKLRKYAEVFESCNFGIPDLLCVTDKRLEQMGIPLGDAHKNLVVD